MRNWIDEICSLLAENDHDALPSRRAGHLEGKLTWARLRALAVEALAPPLLRASDDAIERACTIRSHGGGGIESFVGVARFASERAAIAHAVRAASSGGGKLDLSRIALTSLPTSLPEPSHVADMVLDSHGGAMHVGGWWPSPVQLLRAPWGSGHVKALSPSQHP